MKSTANTACQIAVGTVFTFCTVMSIAFASQSNDQQPVHSAGENVVAEKVDNEAKQINPEKEAHNIFPVTIQTLIFQAVMCLASLYFGMLFTNWGDAVIAGDHDNYFS